MLYIYSRKKRGKVAEFFHILKSGQRPLELARLSEFHLYRNNANGEVGFAQFPMEQKISMAFTMEIKNQSKFSS